MYDIMYALILKVAAKSASGAALNPSVAFLGPIIDEMFRYSGRRHGLPEPHRTQGPDRGHGDPGRFVHCASNRGSSNFGAFPFMTNPATMPKGKGLFTTTKPGGDKRPRAW